MSEVRHVEMQCPKCGKAQSAQVWSSLNVTLDPQLQQDLFEGRVNNVKCNRCGEEGEIVTDLLYHDMQKRFAVLYVPFGLLDADDSLAKFGADGELAREVPPTLPAGVAMDLEYLVRPHIVWDRSELLRYVVFRERLWEARLPHVEQRGEQQR